MNQSDATLLVCWTLPPETNFGARILSFLGPTEEEALRDRVGADQVLSARELAARVRESARKRYIDLVARIGVTVLKNGATLRTSLPGDPASWWYHPVSFKDCEGEPTYDSIVAIELIDAVARDHGITRLTLCGAPPEVAITLGSKFTIDEIAPRRLASRIITLIRALWSRARMAIATWRFARAARSIKPKGLRCDVAFSGFWDWSCWWNTTTGRVQDRYFVDLPQKARAAGVAVCWFAWLDTDSEHVGNAKPLATKVREFQNASDVVPLQSFVTTLEIVRAFADLRPFLRFRAATSLRGSLRDGDFAFHPLFESPLIAGFAGASIPVCSLMALAYERATREYRPRLVISFLEHFPTARALYAGVSRSGGEAWLVQHASYCHEKTFLALDPCREFRGIPDGCAPPRADFVFSMGSLGGRLFEECGYPRDRVSATGSPRYDHLTANGAGVRQAKTRVRILLPTSVQLEPDIDMVEAVVKAVEGLENIDVIVRSHPFRRIDREPRFLPLREHLELSSRSLDDDIADADLVLFTYSTVAEEAFLRGKPAWQWLPLGFNGSALVEVASVPAFGTVAALREALRRFAKNPPEYAPATDVQRIVADELFAGADGRAAERIAERIVSRVS